MIRWPLLAALCLLATSAWPCQICFRGMALTPAQQIATADRAILATPAGDAEYRTVEAIKGDAVTGPVTLAVRQRYDGTLLLVRPTPSATWIVVGPVRRDRAPLLRQIAMATPADDASDAQWSAHAALMLEHLRDPDPLVARIAHDELTRAPYAALRALKPHVDPMALAVAMDDPARQGLYTLLYGIGGGEAAAVERRIDDARRARDATNLAALLAADLEIRGPSRVAWIEKTYLTASDVTLPEMQAALLALSAHGDADAVVPRLRVIAAYRAFMKAHRPMASFVAHDLASWSYWDAGPEYAALLRSKTLTDPASRVAVIAYLMQSPRADARAAARAIAASSQP
jgi:hypothetical protein